MFSNISSIKNEKSGCMKYNKKGFTLLEIIITITILGVTGVFLISFITPLFTISTAVYSETEAISITNTIHNTMIEELRSLSKVNSIEENNTILKYETTKNQNKTLNSSSLVERLFPGRDISITFEDAGNYLITTIIIYNEQGEVVTSTKKTIAPPNLVQ